MPLRLANIKVNVDVYIQLGINIDNYLFYGHNDVGWRRNGTCTFGNVMWGTEANRLVFSFSLSLSLSLSHC